MVFSNSTDHSFPTHPGRKPQAPRGSQHRGVGAGLNRGLTPLKELSIPLGDRQNSSVPPASAVCFPGLENKMQEGQREAISEGRHFNLTRASGTGRAKGAICGQGPRGVSLCAVKPRYKGGAGYLRTWFSPTPTRVGWSLILAGIPRASGIQHGRLRANQPMWGN